MMPDNLSTQRKIIALILGTVRLSLASIAAAEDGNAAIFGIARAAAKTACGPKLADGDTLAGQNCCGRWFLVGSTWFVRQAPDLFGGIDLFFENPLFFYVGSIFVLGLIE